VRRLFLTARPNMAAMEMSGISCLARDRYDTHFAMMATLDPTGPVLIADDDEYFRLALGAIVCGPLGFATTVEAASLDEAFDVLATAEGRIGLALFDLRMPGMESPANLAAVRECHPDLLIVVVSAAQERQQILAALEAGVNGYVPKSFTPAELVRAIKIVIAGDIFVPALLAQIPATERTPPQRLDARLAQTPPSEVSEAMSPRQRQVLELVVKGYSNKQIASELSLAVNRKGSCGRNPAPSRRGQSRRGGGSGSRSFARVLAISCDQPRQLLKWVGKINIDSPVQPLNHTFDFRRQGKCSGTISLLPL
jgi:DNA-binding NarL/FixJ family response regulator